MLCIFPSTPNCILQVCLGDLLSACEVTRGDLGVDLHSRIWGNEMVWDIVPLVDGDSASNYCIVFPGGSAVSASKVGSGYYCTHMSLIEIMLSIFVMPTQTFV
jgi:hypothetical protein